MSIVEGSPGARNGPRGCRKRCLLAAFGALLGIPWAYAYADAVDTEPLEEITVTATKRETKLLETPISMTAIGEEAL